MNFDPNCVRMGTHNDFWTQSMNNEIMQC